MTFEDYKHIIPIQIRFSDIDRLDHVNNACYHNYFELGRVMYFREILKNHVHWDKRGFVLARTEIDHIVPVFLNDEIYCCTKVIKFGNKSMTVKNAIIKKVKNEFVICASGFGVLVGTDYENNISIPIPNDWRELMENFEKSQA
jgi:acyl-CoA thioester hydrolase